ncbi:MAG: 3-methyl-2-oxobutanoate dehydrogenase subunit VorB [bacterium]
MEKKLIKGNEAVAMGALDAGCRFYFGYPITPQNEIPEYLSRHLPRVGGTFIQAESEIASINMLLGAAAAGARAMTSSSSPGISLKQEGISYLAGSELPGVIVNMSRSSPGLGGISASQGDYWQAVKGGGHGDYHLIVLAPHSVQELYDLTCRAFDFADKYRNPAMVLGDAVLGQMKEPLRREPPPLLELPPKDWALSGCKGRAPNVIKSLFLAEGELEQHIWQLVQKYERMKKEIVLSESVELEDAELILVAFGTAARICKSSQALARKAGLRVGLIRPITLFPFPQAALKEASELSSKFLVVELNAGQMVEDVQLAVGKGAEVHFYGRPCGAGSLPTPREIFERIRSLCGAEAGASEKVKRNGYESRI